MAEAVVSLVFLGLVLLAVIACVLGPVATVGFILWHWHKKSIEMSRSRKKLVRRPEIDLSLTAKRTRTDGGNRTNRRLEKG